jgi:hypothetical protein
MQQAGMPCVDASPASHAKLGYTCRPFESLGPANAFSSAAACCGERQRSPASGRTRRRAPG